MKRYSGWLVLLILLLPSLAHAQFQHTSFFNGGTTLTATCTNTTSTTLSQDYFEGTLQGNTTVTLPTAATGCLSGDIIVLKPTAAASQSFTLTVSAGTGTALQTPSNGAVLIVAPTGAASGAANNLQQIWIYNAVAGTPQWELVTQETIPAGLLAVAGGGTGLGSLSTQVSSSTTFTTASGVQFYKAILIGGAGGGASSTGAGFGGNGSPPGMTECTVIGNGQAYAVTIGSAGAKGAAGANGGNGGLTIINPPTNGNNQCFAQGGNGGTAGTASNGAGGTGASSSSANYLATSSGTAGNGIYGIALSTGTGLAGNTGGVTAYSTNGVTAGVGCAGASCTTNTAGQAGTVYFIPEL